MPEFADRHALDEKVSRLGTVRRANHVEIARRQAIAIVLAVPGEDETVADRLSASSDVSARFSAPGEWLVLASDGTPETLARTISALLGEGGHICDQSHGRVLLRLSGPDVRSILAKGVGVDLHPDVFTTGRSANVLCGHISLNLARTGADDYELIVPRSFAESLLDALEAMGRQFGLSVGFTA